MNSNIGTFLKFIFCLRNPFKINRFKTFTDQDANALNTDVKPYVVHTVESLFNLCKLHLTVFSFCTSHGCELHGTYKTRPDGKQAVTPTHCWVNNELISAVQNGVLWKEVEEVDGWGSDGTRWLREEGGLREAQHQLWDLNSVCVLCGLPLTNPFPCLCVCAHVCVWAHSWPAAGSRQGWWQAGSITGALSVLSEKEGTIFCISSS